MHEKPLKGNPYKLTVNQHIFPRSCIARFCDTDGKVTVHLNSETKTEKRKPEAKIFCAKRVWDQKAETGIMQEIEQDYHKFAERFLIDNSNSIHPKEHDIITAMYCLWCIRFSYNKNPIGDQKVDGIVDVALKMSKDDIENLESDGISSVTPNLEIPGRQIAGPKIMLNLMKERKKLKGTKWSVIQSAHNEFIVPDQSLTRMILPLSPILCFIHESDTLSLVAGADEINKILIKNSEDYYFAKSL